MRGELNSFFNPKTICVIGASNTEGKVGYTLMKKLKSFKGKVIPINPNDPKIHGIKSYAKASLYPKNIDLAVIATPRKTVLKILEDIAKKEIKNVIIITAGFSEIGNNKEEKKIIELAKKHKINILGPNCLGIINPEKHINLTFSKESPKEGDTVFLSQSGALGSYIMDLDIPLRAFISLGNMADLTFTDFIEYFNNDEKTKRIVLYIERLKQGRQFIEACKKSNKKIIVVKSGKTEKGQKSTMSHTGSLSTSIDIYKGAFRQAKVTYCDSLTEAFGLKKQDITKKLKGKNIAIITNAGGAGALLTDDLEEKGFKIFGPKDILGTATPQDYARSLHRITNPYDNIIVAFTPQTMSDPINTARAIAKSRWKNKIIAVFLGEKSMKEATEILKGNGIPVFTKAV
ncbi:MAG: CoA-binding protein [Nanoarchaeota archaeon]|jgi:acyl-CoA synthetase (NDP forming)|nr:CoA-binding protein [Nanoarchaeota archaeon]